MPPGFTSAMAYPFKGLSYLLRHRELWKYAAAAFAVNVVLFTALVALFIACRADVVDLLTPDSFWPWLKTALAWVITIAAVLGFLFLFTVVGNVVAGPFLDAMTERMLRSLGETLPPPRGFLRALGRSLVNQSLKLVFFGGIQLALLLLFLTPAAFLHPALSGFLTVLFVAFEYLDYPLDARGRSVPSRFGYLVSHLGPALGLGAVGTAILFVPFLGYAALPASVAGATLLAHRLDGPPVSPP